MKKIIAFILICIMMMSVCACTKPDSDNAAPGTDDNNTTQSGEIESNTDGTVSGDLENPTGGNSTNTNDGTVSSDGSLTPGDTPSSNVSSDSNDDTTSNIPSNPGTDTPSNEGSQSGGGSDSNEGSQSNGGSDSNEGSQSGGESGSEEVIIPEKDPNFDPSKYTYSQYQNMTGEEQEAFFNNFESMNAFFEWLNAAKEKESKENPDKIIGSDGEIN